MFGGICVRRGVLTFLDPPLGSGPVSPMSPLPSRPVEPGHRLEEGRGLKTGLPRTGVSLAEGCAQVGVMGVSDIVSMTWEAPGTWGVSA